MWPEWMFREVDDTVAGIALTTIAIITATWGIAAIAAAFRHTPRANYRCGRIRGFLPCGFEFFLGVFLLLSDAGIYAILGIAVLRSTNGMDLWAFAYTLVCVSAAMLSFGYWARERLPNRMVR